MSIKHNRGFSFRRGLFGLLFCASLILCGARQTSAYNMDPAFDRASHYYTVGWDALAAGNFSNAVGPLEQSYAIYPNSLSAYALCIAYSKLNDSTKTQFYADKALSSTPPLEGSDLDGARGLLEWAKEKNQPPETIGSSGTTRGRASVPGVPAVAPPTVSTLPPP